MDIFSFTFLFYLFFMSVFDVFMRFMAAWYSNMGRQGGISKRVMRKDSSCLMDIYIRTT